MPLSESEMKVIRDLFMDAAGDLLEKEREILKGMVKGLDGKLDGTDERIDTISIRLKGIDIRLNEINDRLKSINEHLENADVEFALLADKTSEINIEVAKLNLASKVSIQMKPRGTTKD